MEDKEVFLLCTTNTKEGVDSLALQHYIHKYVTIVVTTMLLFL